MFALPHHQIHWQQPLQRNKTAFSDRKQDPKPAKPRGRKFFPKREQEWARTRNQRANTVSPGTQDELELLISMADRAFSIWHLFCLFTSLLHFPCFTYCSPHTTHQLDSSSVSSSRLDQPPNDKNNEGATQPERGPSQSKQKHYCFLLLYLFLHRRLPIPLLHSFPPFSITFHFVPFSCCSITIYPKTLPAVLWHIKVSG